MPRARCAALTAALLLTGVLAGCTEPHEDLPPAEVKIVTAYGQTLDESATPEQVTYVLLRSLAEDVKAARVMPPHRQEQKAANRITWSIAAVNTIENRLIETLHDSTKGQAKPSSLGKDRDQQIYKVVNYWAPIVAYYVDSFDTDFEKAASRMRVQVAPDNQAAHVYYDVWHVEQQGQASVGRPVRLDIELALEEAGGKTYWRVARVGYEGVAVTRPAGAPAAPLTRPEVMTAPS